MSYDCYGDCEYCSRHWHARVYRTYTEEEKKLYHLYSAVRQCTVKTFVSLLKKYTPEELQKPFDHIHFKTRNVTHYRDIFERLIELERYDLIDSLPQFQQFCTFPREISIMLLKYVV